MKSVKERMEIKPTRWDIEIHDWQGQGFFGEIWSMNGPIFISVCTLPRPNMSCPDELYKTRKECRDACKIKVKELRTGKVG